MAEFTVNEPTTVWVCPSVNGKQFGQVKTRIVFEVDGEGTNIAFLEDLNIVNEVGSGEVWIKIRESENGPLLFSYNAHLRMLKNDVLYVRADYTEERWRFAHRMPYIDQSQPVPLMSADPLLRLDPNSREFLQAIHAAYAEGLANFGNFMKGIKEFSMPSNNQDERVAEITPTDEQRAAKINAAAEDFNRLVQEAAAAGLRTDIDLFPINRVGTQPYSIVRTEVVRIIGKAPEQGKVTNNG